MIKTIKVKEEFTFRELMEYVIQNDVSGTFVSSDDREFSVNSNGEFYFDVHYYNHGETYEVDVLEEITEDAIFDYLITVESNGGIYNEYKKSIGSILRKTNNVVQILASVDGKYRTVWENE